MKPTTRKIKSFTLMVVMTIVLGLSFLPSQALAESQEEKDKASNYGINPIAEKAGLTGSSLSKSTVPVLIGNIVAVALSFTGVAFFILILYAGILWMTAAGNAERVDKAKTILTAASIGLVIVLSAYAITKFVFSSLGVRGGGGAGGGTAAESAPAGGRNYATCDLDNDNAICGDTYVCYNGNCVSKCEAEHPGVSAACMAPSACQFDVAMGLCPHGDVCCY